MINRQQGNDHDRGPGEDVECPPVVMAAHEVSVIGQKSRADEHSAGQSMCYTGASPTLPANVSSFWPFYGPRTFSGLHR